MSTGNSQTPLHPTNPNQSNHGVVTGNGSSSNTYTHNFTQPFNTLNQQFSLKLDRNNYTLCNRLDGFINGSRPCPPEFIPAPTSTDEKPKVMGCASSATLWSALENLFGAHSRAKIDDTRTLIHTTRKGTTPMVEYLRQKKMWLDSLALARDPYPEAHLISNVTSGLDAQYLAIVVQIEARSNISWQETHDMLLSFDSKFERLHAVGGNNKGNGTSGICTRPSANLAAANILGNQQQIRIEEEEIMVVTLETVVVHPTIEEVTKDKATRRVLLQGTLKNGLYQLQPPVSKSNHHHSILSVKNNQNQYSMFTGVSILQNESVAQPVVNEHSISVSDMWHRRLGHPSSRVLKQVLKNVNVNVNPSSNENYHFCDACQYGKSHALPFKNSANCASKVLDLHQPTIQLKVMNTLIFVAHTNYSESLSAPAVEQEMQEQEPVELVVQQPVSSHPIVTRAKAGIFKPKVYLGKTKWNPSLGVPSCNEEALKSKEWNDAFVSYFTI
uniref:GAG-pre-integrase domain-containing protein n=1 Tax=Cannabis sativa TaxID=3483 RepID=A0A803QBQ7_CANSA